MPESQPQRPVCHRAGVGNDPVGGGLARTGNRPGKALATSLPNSPANCPNCAGMTTGPCAPPSSGSGGTWEMESEAEAEVQRQNAAHKKRLIGMLRERNAQTNQRETALWRRGSGQKQGRNALPLKCDLPIDDLLDGTWQGEGTACPHDPASVPSRSGVSAERRQSTSPQKPKPDVAESKPRAKPTPKPKCSLQPKSGGVKTPAKPQKSSRLKANPAQKSDPHIPPPTKSTGNLQSHTVDRAEKPATPSLDVPGPDPEKEAYNRWFRMKCGAEPFDPVELQKLYAAIPVEDTSK